MKRTGWQERQSLLMAIHDAGREWREMGGGFQERFKRSINTNALIIQALFAGASPRSIIHSFARENNIKGAISGKT